MADCREFIGFICEILFFPSSGIGNVAFSVSDFDMVLPYLVGRAYEIGLNLWYCIYLKLSNVVMMIILFFDCYCIA